MALPKSVIKIKKDGVEFVSNVDQANYTLRELTKGALRDVGKLLRRRFRENYYKEFKKRTGNAGKSMKAKVVWKRDEGVHLDIGVPHAHRGFIVKGFYTYFHELGTSKFPAKNILKNTSQQNIPEIRRIEAQYLSAINDDTWYKLIGQEEDEIIVDDE